jgi:hypothetical protein
MRLHFDERLERRGKRGVAPESSGTPRFLNVRRGSAEQTEATAPTVAGRKMLSQSLRGMASTTVRRKRWRWIRPSARDDDADQEHRQEAGQAPSRLLPP